MDNLCNTKIQSNEQNINDLLPNLQMFLSFDIILKARIQKNLSKSLKFWREISITMFFYNLTIAFMVQRNFTYDSEIHGFMRHYYDSLRLYFPF